MDKMKRMPSYPARCATPKRCVQRFSDGLVATIERFDSGRGRRYEWRISIDGEDLNMSFADKTGAMVYLCWEYESVD